MVRKLPDYNGTPLNDKDMQDALIVYGDVIKTFGVGSKEAAGVTERIGDERFKRRALILDNLMANPGTDIKTDNVSA